MDRASNITWQKCSQSKRAAPCCLIATIEMLVGLTLLQNMKSRMTLMLVLLTFVLSGTIFGAETAVTNADSAPGNADKAPVKPWVRKLAFGILLHDVGFISDHKQRGGVDPNW